MAAQNNKKEQLAKREAERKKRPTFKRHAAHRKSKLSDRWRRPRGLQNKLRLNKKSRGTPVRVGYRSPALVRGLTKSGKKALLVHNVNELHNAEPEVHEVIIAAGLGARKRLMIIKEAQEQGFTIINLNAKQKADEISKQLAERKTERSKRLSKQAEREKSLEKKAKKEEAKAEKKAEKKEAGKTEAKNALSDDEKKKQKIKEQEKILTKKDAQ